MTDAEEHLRSLPVVDVTAVDISPNPAALTDELNLEVDFHLDKPVASGVWDIEVGAFPSACLYVALRFVCHWLTLRIDLLLFCVYDDCCVWRCLCSTWWTR